MAAETPNPLSQAAQSCREQLTERLIHAAAAQEIRIDRNSISIGIAPTGGVIVNAAVEGLANIDMIDYENGVLTNFVYTGVSGPGFAPGFYAKTIYACWVKLGRVDIRVHYSQNGNLIAVNPGIAIVTSLRVRPNVEPFVQTGVRIGSNFPSAAAGDDDDVDHDVDGPPIITTYTDCSTNGGSICESYPYGE